MITVSNLGMQFGGQWLFQHVDLQFLPGNCYGIIGANGAGKSTFLRILTGELDSTNGSVTIDPTKRVSVLKQNQNAYDDYTVMDTVIMGNAHLYEVMKEKDAIYEKPDFTDEDGGLPTWKPNSPSWAAGKRNPTPPACCRVWASARSCTMSRWPPWIPVSR